jgi:hypothetical protein
MGACTEGASDSCVHPTPGHWNQSNRPDVLSDGAREQTFLPSRQQVASPSSSPSSVHGWASTWLLCRAIGPIAQNVRGDGPAERPTCCVWSSTATASRGGDLTSDHRMEYGVAMSSSRPGGTICLSLLRGILNIGVLSLYQKKNMNWGGPSIFTYGPGRMDADSWSATIVVSWASAIMHAWPSLSSDPE